MQNNLSHGTKIMTHVRIIIPFCFTLFFAVQTSLPMEFTKNAVSQITPYVKIFANVTAATLGYGILHATANMAITSSTRNLSHFVNYGLQNGLAAMTKPALFLGTALALITRVGPLPQLNFADLKWPLLTSAGVVSLLSIFEGVRSYKLHKNKSFNKKLSNTSPEEKYRHAGFRAQQSMIGLTYLTAAPLLAYIAFQRYRLS